MTPKDETIESRFNRKDVYTRVTDRIIADLEKGTRTWMKPWSGDHAAGKISRPLRHCGTPYRGMNILLLWRWKPSALHRHENAYGSRPALSYLIPSALRPYRRIRNEKRRSRPATVNRFRTETNEQQGANLETIASFNALGAEFCRDSDHLGTKPLRVIAAQPSAPVRFGRSFRT